MNLKQKQLYNERAKILKAMAHPTRLYIIDILSKKESCVCELTELIKADISTVSKHLSVLKNAGIVSDSKMGTKVYYNLLVPCVLDFITCTEKVLQSHVNYQLELLAK